MTPTPIDQLRNYTQSQRQNGERIVRHDLDQARANFAGTIDEFAKRIAAHGYRGLEYYLWEDTKELYIGKEIEQGPVGNRLIVLFDENGQHSVVRAGEQSYVHEPKNTERDEHGNLILVLKNPRINPEIVIDEAIRQDKDRMEEITRRLAAQQPESMDGRHSEWHVFDVMTNTTEKDIAALEISAKRVKHWNTELGMGRFGRDTK